MLVTGSGFVVMTKGLITYKIDLEKAYDRLKWSFLRDTLLDFGFDCRIVNQIMHCVTTSSFSILWNESKLPHFQPSRGLRRGDPLSSYMFVLCMEKLSLLINRKVKNKEWLSLFSQATIQQALIVKDTFKNICLASGLKISDGESKAFCSPGINRSIKTSIQKISNIFFTNRLGRYFGIPLLQGRVKIVDFHFVIQMLKT